MAIEGFGELPTTRRDEIEKEAKQLRSVMKYVISCYIKKTKIESCEGCQKNYSSQRDHACLMDDPVDLVRRHFECGIQLVTKPVLSAIYAYQDARLPFIDVDAYKTAHKVSLIEEMKEEAYGDDREEMCQFYDMSEAFKMFT